MSAVTAAGDDYVAFCEGLRQICGVDLSQYKRPQMERRLRSFFARKDIDLLTDTLDSLRKDKTELDALLDRVTINVSQLWRHPEQWARLERGVLAELAAAGPVRAWSAGCSYGAEAAGLSRHQDLGEQVLLEAVHLGLTGGLGHQLKRAL